MTPEQKAAKAKAAAKAQAKLIASMTPNEQRKVARGLSTKSPEAKAALRETYKANKAKFGERIAATSKSEAKITASMHLNQAKRLLAEAKKMQAQAAAAQAAAKATAKAHGKSGRGMGSGSGSKGGTFTGSQSGKVGITYTK